MLENVLTVAIVVSILVVVVVARYINPAGRHPALVAEMKALRNAKKQNSGTITLYPDRSDRISYNMDELRSFNYDNSGALHIWLTNGEEIIFNGTWKVER